jgi:hypothetical protein
MFADADVAKSDPTGRDQNRKTVRLFQNPGLLGIISGIISGLFERKGGRGVCLSWLTSRRFSTTCNASFFLRSQTNSVR